MRDAQLGKSEGMKTKLNRENFNQDLNEILEKKMKSNAHKTAGMMGLLKQKNLLNNTTVSKSQVK